MTYDSYFPGGSIGPVRGTNLTLKYNRFVSDLQAQGGAIPTTATAGSPQAYVRFNDKGEALYVFDPKKDSEAAENALEKALEDVVLSMKKKDLIYLDVDELDAVVSEIKAAVVLAAKEARG